MESTPNYFAQIPADVRYDKELVASAKLLYGEITCLSNTEGFCWASNAYFAELYNVSTRTIQRWISQLEEKKYIFVDISTDEAFHSLRKMYIVKPYEKNFTPHDKNVIPPRQNCHPPHDKNVVPPHDKNVTLSNTSINNTSNNNKKNKDLKNIRSNSDELGSKSTETKALPKNGTPSKKLSSSELEREFDQIWAIYPKKVGKKKSFEAFKKARNDKKTPYEDIENGLYKYVRYLQEQGTEAQYIPHGSTWFNRAGWEDEYITHAPQKKPKNMMEYVKQKYGGVTHEFSRNGEVSNVQKSAFPEF